MNVSRAVKKSLIACSTSVALLVTGCAQPLFSSADDKRSVDSVVTNNLKQIWWLLYDAIGDRDVFPKSLAELNNTNVNANLFICPGRGSKAASMRSIEQWTDYIYVGSVWPGVPRTALIISPPENHGGGYGYVFYADSCMAQLPAATIHALVKEPWIMDTNASASNIDYLKKRISIRVPRRLLQHYPARIDAK